MKSVAKGVGAASAVVILGLITRSWLDGHFSRRELEAYLESGKAYAARALE